MANYNSKGWRTFRRIVPHKARWFLAFPIFLLYAATLTAEGAWKGFKAAMDKYIEEWNG